MAEKITFSVSPRTVAGKAVKTLRNARVVPANITIPNQGSVAVQAEEKAVVKLYETAGDTGLIYMTVAGESAVRPVLIEDVQVDSMSNRVVHMVFKQVNLKEKIEAEVPVVLVGESSVPNTVVVTVVDSIEVEALPTDFPEAFTIDISKLTQVGQMVTFAELEYDKSKVTLKIDPEELTTPVVMLQEHKEEKEEVAPEPTPEVGAATPPGPEVGAAADAPQAA